MNYTRKQETEILLELAKGKSNREVARALNISESGIRGFLKRHKPQESPKTTPKILVFDLETSPALVYTFGRKKQFINQDAVVKEGGKILMAAVRWLGEKESTVLVNKEDIRRGEDYWVCEQLFDLLGEADAVVAHNGRAFDFNTLETRLLANGFPASPSVHHIDTCLIAKKKFRFPDNKLDTISAYLGIGRKISNSGIDLWVKVMQGDEAALLEMVEYCKWDNELLYDVFLELRSRGLVSGFNAGTYTDKNTAACNVCGSHNITYTGRYVTTPVGKYEEIQCDDCGNVCRSRTNLLSKEKRSNILAPIKK